MTVVLFPSSSNVYQTMLRQLLWVSIICVWKVNAYDDFFQRPCDIPQCNEIDEYLNAHVNVDESSCNNFLSYACQYNTTGAFGSKYASGYDHSHQMTDSIDKEKYVLAKIFHHILSESIDVQSTNRALNWERQVYDKCRKNVNRDNEYQKYVNHLDEAGRLDKDYRIDYYNNNTNDIVSWVIPDRKYAMRGAGFAFFNVKIVTLDTDELAYTSEQSSRYVQISPMSVSDPLDISNFFTSYYKHDRPSTQAIKYRLLGKFISELNQIAPRLTDHGEGESKDVESYQIKDWQAKWDMHSAGDSNLDWLEHLNSIGLSLRRDDTILVKNWAYFENLAQKMHSTHMNAITDFVHLRYIMKTIGFVKPEYSQYTIIPAIKGFTCAPGLMVGVVHSYLSKYFPLDNKRSLESIFNELRSNIKENLGVIGESSYHTIATTTKKFLRKLYDSNVVIGYPDWVSSNTTTTFYSINAVSDHYFQNQLYALESLQRRQVKSYTYSTNTELYEMDIYYKSLKKEDFNFDLTNNEIILPMSLFNEHDYKYFSSLLYHPMNYASAGTAIAQKLYKTYLEEISYATQTDLPSCIEHRASGLYNERKKNYILDSASWLLAVRDSFKISPGLDGLPIRFKKFGAILPKHLFYVIFAQSLCKLPNSASEGPAHHINFALSNSWDFVKTFRCDAKDKLYKSNSTRCEPLQQYLK